MENMQKVHLETKGKSKVLLVISIALLFAFLPVFLSHFMHGHGLHVSIHLASIILGSFLSIVGAISYLEFKTSRLFLMMCAFCAITVAEIASAVNIVFLFWPSYSSVDSLITHGLILAMLSFFVVGIFRTD